MCVTPREITPALTTLIHSALVLTTDGHVATLTMRLPPVDPRLPFELLCTPDCDPPAAHPSHPIGPNNLTGAMVGTFFACPLSASLPLSVTNNVRPLYTFAVSSRRPSRPFGGGGVVAYPVRVFLFTRRRGAAFAILTSAAVRSGRIARPLRVRIGAFIQSAPSLQ